MFKVCVGFAVGALVAALGIISIGPPIPGKWPRFDTWSMEVIGLFSISGAIGGASLRKGWRPVIGFALAFGVLGSWMPAPINDGGFPSAKGWGYWPFWMLMSFVIIVLSVSGAILFGLAGAIGVAISGLGSRLALAAARAFGAAGAIGGTVFAIIGAGQVRGRTNIPEFLVFFIPLLTIYALGGALFAVASEREECNKRKKLRLCLKCGYELTGNVSGVCPECGTEIETT